MQPPVGYEREQLRHYDATSPLNRLIDAVPPESETAREFAEAAKAVVAGNASPEQRREVRRWLVVWRENDAKLEPGLAKSDLTAELAPVSQTLSEVATFGLEALDVLENHRTLDVGIAQRELEILKQAEKPQAVLLDMVVAPVESLVQAAAAQ